MVRLLTSLGLAAGATVTAVALGLAVGVHIGRPISTSRRGGAALIAVCLVPILLPPHVAAYVWRFTLEDAAAALAPGTALWRSPGWSRLGVAWTLAAMYWPIPALAAAVGLRLRGTRLAQELATLAPPAAVFWRAVLPGLAPAIAAGAGVVFLLSLGNYGVPLMWNVPAQSVAVFARLTAFYGTREALILSLPLQAAALGLCLTALIWLARRPYGLDPLGCRPSPARGVSGGGRVWHVLAGAVVVLTVAVPVAALVAHPGLVRMVQADLLVGGGPFGWGLALGAIGASGAVLLGLSGAAAARRGGRPVEMALEVVGLWAFFAPAAVLCAILAGVLNRPGWLGAVYDSLWVFAPAYGVRFFYLPWKVVRFAQRFEGPRLAETERVLGLGRVTRWQLALGGPRRAAVCLAWLLVFALVLGELEIAAFLAQPGRQPIGVFLDNLMHYGRSATVAKWCALVVAAEAVVAGLVLWVGLSQWRKLRVTG